MVSTSSSDLRCKESISHVCRQEALFGCNGVITLQRHTLPSLLLIGAVRIIGGIIIVAIECVIIVIVLSA